MSVSKGNVVLLVGASRGIGKQLAKQLAAAKRKREVIPSLEGRLLLISHRLLPGLTEQIIAGSSMNYAKDR